MMIEKIPTTLLFFLLITIDVSALRVAVAGASGYIGRQVVSELVSKGVPTVALVRSLNLPEKTKACLEGAELVVCNVLEAEDVTKVYERLKPTSTICCLASRSGIRSDAWAVDYQGGKNVLLAQERMKQSRLEEKEKTKLFNHFVLLSAFCCGKPKLQFQFAKIRLEEEIQNSRDVTYSIVRPTAFFKSLDGQLESARKGYPILYFGDGSCSANAICEKDLANYLIDCALEPDRVGMMNSSRDIGGPDVPPISKKEQIELIYDTLEVPEKERNAVSIPSGVFDFLVTSFSSFEKVFGALNMKKLQMKFEDAAEITRIVKYYAEEPMVAIGPGEVQGTRRLKDHFQAIAERGGKLEEIDKMTTTTGVLEVFTKNEYVK